VTVEIRPDGSVLLTRIGAASWGLAAAGLAIAAFLTASVVTGELGPLGATLVVPVAIIAALTAVAVLRHRDWLVFDPAARQILFRLGTASIFRPVSALPFADVEAIVLHESTGGHTPVGVALRREGDVLWPLGVIEDPAVVTRVVAALHEVGRWPVVRERQPVPR
jgi:hypothetical protein